MMSSQIQCIYFNSKATNLCGEGSKILGALCERNILIMKTIKQESLWASPTFPGLKAFLGTDDAFYFGVIQQLCRRIFGHF